MLSRVADAIYWMSRYIERAENTARIINVNANLLLDLPKKVKLGWQPVIDISGNKALFNNLYNEANERNVVKFTIADLANPGSLLSSLYYARENARTVREIIPRESWEQLNALYLSIKANLPAGLNRRQRFDFLGSIIGTLQLITGLLAGTMLRDPSFNFLRMGRDMERADMITRIVDVRSGNLMPEGMEELLPYENIQWMSVLQSLSAYQSYRQSVQGPVQRNSVIRFLISEQQFPRAFLYCLEGMHNCLKSLPRNSNALCAIEQLIQRIDRTKPENMTSLKLHKFLDKLQMELGDLHQIIFATYFKLDIDTPKRRASARRESGAQIQMLSL